MRSTGFARILEGCWDGLIEFSHNAFFIHMSILLPNAIEKKKHFSMDLVEMAKLTTRTY